MCLFLAKYTPTSLLQQKYTLIRQLPEKHHKSQPSLQKSKIPTLEAFMWHLRNVDFQIPFTELQGVNVSILEYRIYIHTVVFSQIYPLGIFLSLCLCPCLCLYPPYFSVSLYLSVFQFAFVCLSLLCVCVHVCAYVELFQLSLPRLLSISQCQAVNYYQRCGSLNHDCSS